MHRVSLSFLVDTMDKRRGGCAPNIAYTLALLGERPRADGDGRRGLRRVPHVARGGRRRHVARASRSPGKFTASFFCSTDQHNNQIASFYTGAMARRRRAVVPDDRRTAAWRSSRRTIPGAMVQYADECRALGIRYIFDPGQQCARMSGDELREGVVGATIVICNDYEFELLRQKTGLGEQRHPRRQARRSIVTRGEHGSSIVTERRTGRRAAGDAARASSIRPASATPSAAGFLKGLALGLSCRRARRWAAWPRPTRSSTSAARATPTPGTSSGALRGALRTAHAR